MLEFVAAAGLSAAAAGLPNEKWHHRPWVPAPFCRLPGRGEEIQDCLPHPAWLRPCMDFDGCLVPQSMVHESWKEDRWHRLIGSLTTFRVGFVHGDLKPEGDC